MSYCCNCQSDSELKTHITLWLSGFVLMVWTIIDSAITKHQVSIFRLHCVKGQSTKQRSKYILA